MAKRPKLEEAEQQLRSAEASVKQAEESLKLARQEESAARQKASSMDDKLERARREKGKLQELRFILSPVTGPSKRVVVLRVKLRSKQRRSLRDDITVAEQSRLESEVLQLRKELQKACSHPWVVYHEGYSGSQFNDYDDGYPEERLCAVCGLWQRGSKGELADSDTRLRKCDWQDKGFGFWRATLGWPIRKVQQIFIDSVGQTNVNTIPLKEMMLRWAGK